MTDRLEFCTPLPRHPQSTLCARSLSRF